MRLRKKTGNRVTKLEEYWKLSVIGSNTRHEIAKSPIIAKGKINRRRDEIGEIEVNGNIRNKFCCHNTIWSFELQDISGLIFVIQRFNILYDGSSSGYERKMTRDRRQSLSLSEKRIAIAECAVRG